MSESPMRTPLVQEPGPRLKRGEIVGGWIMMVVYTAVMAYVAEGISLLWEKLFGSSIGEKILFVLPYFICFIACVIIFRRHLARELRMFGKNLGRCIITGIVGYAAIYAMSLVVNLILVIAGVDVTANPNQNAIYEMYDTNRQALIASACMLGPLVEEVIYRSTVYGSIARRNKIVAHIVNWFFFGAIHVVQFAFMYGDPKLLIHVLAYIPHSVGMAVVYERSGSVWTCIFLHMIINIISIGTIGLM
ncbi:MAG: CPBP family intramembrane metalloprotease [Oscillospiraceae bacterium]|nr:CPBP family intramembrane metalloprotease [Oscillospiraceae bacterium]